MPFFNVPNRNLALAPHHSDNGILYSRQRLSASLYNLEASYSDCSAPYDLSFRSSQFPPSSDDTQTTPLNLSLSSRVVGSEDVLWSFAPTQEGCEEADNDMIPIDYSICKTITEPEKERQKESLIPLNGHDPNRTPHQEKEWKVPWAIPTTNNLAGESQMLRERAKSETKGEFQQGRESQIENPDKNTQRALESVPIERTVFHLQTKEERTILYAHHLLLQRYRKRDRHFETTNESDHHRFRGHPWQGFQINKSRFGCNCKTEDKTNLLEIQNGKKYKSGQAKFAIEKTVSSCR